MSVVQAETEGRERGSFISAWIIRAGLIYGLRSIGSLTMGALHIPGWDTPFYWLSYPISRLLDVTLGYERYGAIFPGLSAQALFIGLIWALLDRPRKYEPQLREIARLLCSYALGAQVLVYAFTKFFATGWPAGLARPSVFSVFAQLGDGEPSQAFWWWIGIAPTYAWFTAVVELAAGIMMFVRRTSTFATLLNLAILMNIAVMMMGYTDYPLMQTIPASRFPLVAFLLWNDWDRLAAFFGQDREEVVAMRPTAWKTALALRLLLAAQVLFFIRTAYVDWTTMYAGSTMAGPIDPVSKRLTILDLEHKPTLKYYRAPLDGIYQVEKITHPGDLPDSAAQMLGWHHVVIQRCQASARRANDEEVFFSLAPVAPTQPSQSCVAVDPEPDGGDVRNPMISWPPPTSIDRTFSRTLSLRAMRPLAAPDTLRYTETGEGRLALVGVVRGAPLIANLRRIPDEKYPLYDPHWWHVKK